MSWLMIAIRNILRDSTRVMSTVLIIAVGLAALLVGGGFMLSTYDSLQEIAMRSEGHVIVLDDGQSPVLGGTHQQLTLSNWKTIQDDLLADSRVLRILPRVRFEGVISNGNNSAAFFGSGVDPKEEFRVHGPFLRTTAGNTLDPWLTEQDISDVVLGEQLARTLGAEVDNILKIQSRRSDGQHSEVVVRLAGLYHTGTPEIDDHSLMISLNTVSSLLGSDSISQLSIYLEQGEDAPTIKQYIQDKYSDVVVQTWDQRAELYIKVKALYDRIFRVMGLIILIVVFLAITNTIALAIYQRRDEIATLGALGTRPIRIYINFMIEAILIGIVASSLGMLFAYMASNAVNLSELMMPAPPGKTEGYPLFIYVSWTHYIVTSLVLIAIVVLASFIAAYNNARVNIAEALS